MKGRWVPHDLRDRVIDFVVDWSEKTEIPNKRFIAWLGISRPKFYDWKKRYGRANEHNGKIPRDFWLEPWERRAILDFHEQNPLEGYRRATYMMLDADVVAVSASTVYRVLKAAGRLDRWNRSPSTKGSGFEQPSKPHEHWYTDIAYINLGGTFYYLISVLDGYSRFLVHWELRESMTSMDVEIVLQRASERFRSFNPRIISDNGSAFIAKDFKIFVREAGMTHVRTSAFYPQSNGKVERWHRTIKNDAIRRYEPSDPDQACRIVSAFVHHYNEVRPHSSLDNRPPAEFAAALKKDTAIDRERSEDDLEAA